MVVELRMYSVVENFIRIHLKYKKCLNDVKVLSLSANSTFKIIRLGDYVLRRNVFKLSNNDREQ